MKPQTINQRRLGLSQPGQEFDPVQQFPPVQRVLVSNDQAVPPDILLRELRCLMQDNDMIVPAFIEDCLIIQTSGQCDMQGRVIQPFRQLRVTPGDIGIIPHDLSTEWRITGYYDILNLFLNPAFMATVVLEAYDTDPVRVEFREQVGGRDPLIYSIGLALRDDIIAGGFTGRLYADSLAHTLIVHLLRDYAIFRLDPPQLTYDISSSMLQRVMDYIQANLDQDLTLAEIAGVVYLSPYHLTRLFKRAMGQSLHQYVIAQRVIAAQRLITAGQLSLAEIATKVGFADQSHLTRHFKRLQGISPAVFAHQRKNIL